MGMVKAQRTQRDSARGQRPKRRSVTALGAVLLLAPACAPLLPDASLKPLNRAVLVCADSDPELFDELKPKFTRLEVSHFAENPECVRGKSAAGEVGHTCLTDEASCSTPRFVDGKPIETPSSAYDLVLLFPQLLHGSLSAKTVSTTRMVTAGGASGGLGPVTQGRGATRGGARAKNVTDSQVTASPETDYTGEVFSFEPRPGLLHPGKHFKDLAPELLRELLLDLLRR